MSVRIEQCAEMITGLTVVASLDPRTNYQYPPSQGGYIEVFGQAGPDGVVADPESVLHEVCHWLVATSEERQSENLGVPWDEEAARESGTAPVILDERTQRVREAQVRMVEAGVYRAAGLPVPEKIPLLEISPDDASEVVTRLLSLGEVELEMLTAIARGGEQ